MNKPKIRFKGFEGEWKDSMLSDFSYSICSGRDTAHKGIYPLYGSTGIIGTTNKPSYNGAMLLVARVGANAGKLQIINEECGVSDNTLIIKPNGNISVSWLYYYLVHCNLNHLVYGSGQPLITGYMLKRIPILLGSKKECDEIASYFTALDTQIAASTSRLSSLKQIKAASLLNMFPQKGETVPRVRFKGFQGEWKKVKIGDVAPLTGGFAFQSGQFKTSGVPIIRISNILSSGIVGGDFVYYNEFKGDSEFRLYKGDVVIAMSGATTGKVATFEANDFGYQNQRVGKFSRTNLVNYELLSKLVSAPNFQKKIISKLTSSAQPNASSKDIDSIDLVVPEETEEQRAIASYFTALDAQITLHCERLEKLKQIKAACLEKMFA